MSKKKDVPQSEEALQPETVPAENEQAEETNIADDIAELRTQLEEAVKQREEYLNLAQRVQADFENFRRRNSGVRAEAYEDGARAFIKTILPVIDNLERALAAESNDQALKEGVTLVYRQLSDVLEKRGVTVIDRTGEKFDPALENAVMQGTADEGASLQKRSTPRISAAQSKRRSYPMNFGEKVKLLRKRAHMSQAALAAELGVSTRTVQSYEKGQSYPKQRSIYAKLAALFNVEQNYLLTESEAFAVSANEQYGSRGKREAKELLAELTGLFAGGEMSEEDMDALMYEVQKAYIEAKEANKRFSPKK